MFVALGFYALRIALRCRANGERVSHISDRQVVIVSRDCCGEENQSNDAEKPGDHEQIRHASIPCA